MSSTFDQKYGAATNNNNNSRTSGMTAGFGRGGDRYEGTDE